MRLYQCHLVFGNEPLLKQDAIQNIIQAARQQGFDDKLTFEVDNQFDWQPVFDSCQALSLFAAKQIILVNLPESGANTSQANALKQLAGMLHPEVLLILSGPRLNQKQEASQWFKAFKQQGSYTPCNTPELRQLPNFIKKRAEQLGLTLAPCAVELLAAWHEGNLLALDQSLQKLQLLFANSLLTREDIATALSAHNHYSPFQLIDALLIGNGKRAIGITRQLEAEGTEITLLLRLVQKELQLLYQMQERIQAGQSLASLFEHFRIWQQKKPLYQSALQRLPVNTLIALLNYLTKLEFVVKMDFSVQPWSQFNELCLKMC